MRAKRLFEEVARTEKRVEALSILLPEFGLSNGSERKGVIEVCFRINSGPDWEGCDE